MTREQDTAEPCHETDSLLFCQLTPKGRGAVAAIDVQLPTEMLSRWFTPASGIPIADLPAGRVVFGHWNSAPPAESSCENTTPQAVIPAEVVVESLPAEDVVVTVIGKNQFEVHCHGGTAAVERIVRNLKAAGATPRSPTSYLSQKHQGHWLATEVNWTLLKTTTFKTARLLLSQPTAWGQAISTLLEQKPARGSSRHEATDWLSTVHSAVQTWRAEQRIGSRLTSPWRVVLCGPPNVGKSSLINALVGYERSVVYDQPGTTRDVVKVQTAYDGWPIQFSDTAGLRSTTDEIEAAGVARAEAEIGDADCLIVVSDATEPMPANAEALLESFPDALHVENKCDLTLQTRISESSQHPSRNRALSVSALTGQNIEVLLGEILRRLLPVPPSEDTPLVFCEPLQRWLAQLEKVLAEAGPSCVAQVTDLLQAINGSATAHH